MPSRALAEWETTRAKRLDQLFAAHRKVGGSGVGRRWQTEQLNWALVLRLAAEFQGFALRLHDQAAEVFAVQAAGLNADVESMLSFVLTRNRALDTKNANKETVASDFLVLGISLWPKVNERFKKGPLWADRLNTLNRARNAIAHGDEARLLGLANDGYDVSHLETVRKWRSSTANLAKAMDTVVDAHLTTLFGRRPW